jgi:ankyrin repeat protein
VSARLSPSLTTTAFPDTPISESSDLFSTSLTSRSTRKHPKQHQYREALVKALEFDHIEDRYNNIRDPHYATCEWLFTNTIYQSWLDQDRISYHHGILWLKGKPGTGKSTLVKFAQSKARETTNEDIHISFFFNARGSPLEKDTMGMYRSLLFQLFTMVPSTQEVFDNIPNFNLPRSPHWSWTMPQLENVFKRVVRELEARPLWIFVDALDECDEDQIRDMVGFFDLLGREAMRLNIIVRVFFASRHYPKITITHKVELILEDEEEHSCDIERYIENELRTAYHTCSDAVENIRKEVKRRASGVFIWVVLVVQILNKAYDYGRVTGLEKKLQEIPNDLGELFKGILTRDDQNMEYMRLCIQWILLAARPLSREELYFAILSGTEPGAMSPWTGHECPAEVMDAFILSCSKGLAELTTSDRPTVQFIHETIRDFLLKGEGMVFMQELSSQSFLGFGHDSLKQCCANYISVVQEVVLADTNSTQERLPFVRYALWWVLFHANAAEVNGVDQASFLQDFPIQRWIQLTHVISSGIGPTPRYLGHELHWDPGPSFALDSSLLYVLAEQNFGSLIQTILRTNPQIDIEGGHFRRPLFTALEHYCYDALNGLLTSDHSDELVSASVLSIDPPNLSELVGLLTTYKSCYELAGSPSSALQFFSQWGTESNAWVLLRSGRFDQNAAISTQLPCSPLSFAAGRGYEVLAESLLGIQDVDPDSEDELGLTPLSKAARNGRFKIASLLLQDTRGVNVNSRSHDGRSPLSYAAENGHEAIFNLLLAHPDVDVNLRDNKGRTPLFHAAACGREAILSLLKEKPLVDFISRDDNNHTALSYAVLNGHEEVVKQLLESRKIDVNSKDSLHGRTALMFAFEYGYQSIAELLLDIPGIDISIRDNRGRTLLDYAQRSGHEGMASLLPSIH